MEERGRAIKVLGDFGFRPAERVWHDARLMPFAAPPRRLLLALLLAGVGLVLARPARASLPATMVELPVAFGEAARALPRLLAALVPGPCLAVGWPSFGRLENGVLAHSTTGLNVRSRDAWGTPETVAALRRAAQEVATLHPGRTELVVTDISRREGGHLRPHRTHQNGRDVDVLVYRRGPKKSDELDLERLWTLLSVLRREGLVEVILLDRGVQGRLYNYARDAVGLPAAELSRLFEYPRSRREGRHALVRHAPGHRGHLHLRFRSTEAVAASAREDTRRGLERLVHVASRQDTLLRLATEYQTTPQEIAAENRLGPRTKLRRGERLFILRPRPTGVAGGGAAAEKTSAQGG